MNNKTVTEFLKNVGDLRGRYPPLPKTPSSISIIFQLDDTQPHSIIFNCGYVSYYLCWNHRS